MGMETSQFGKLLVIATGEILNKTVDTKVAIDLVTKITRNMQIWLDDNLSVLLFKAISVILILMVFHFLARLVSKLVLKLGSNLLIPRKKLRARRMLRLRSDYQRIKAGDCIRRGNQTIT